MDFKEYQKEAAKTAIYPKDLAIEYLMLGLCSESGEVAGIAKKVIRDYDFYNVDCIKKELGDVLWYIAQICSEFEISLEDCAIKNIEKLNDRQKRNKLQGSGDNR